MTDATPPVKLYAGNPHARFDEAAMPRRGLLYKYKTMRCVWQSLLTVAAIGFMLPSVGDTGNSVVIGMDSFINYEMKTVQKGQTIRLEYDSSKLNFSVGEGFYVILHYDDITTNLVVSTCPASGSMEWSVPATIRNSWMDIMIAKSAESWDYGMYFNVIDRIPDGVYGWVGGDGYYGGGNWSDLSNWVVGMNPAQQLPGKDDVVMLSGEYYGITIDGTYEIGELRCTSSFNLWADSGALTVRSLTTTNKNVYASVGNLTFNITDKIIGDWYFYAYDSKIGFPDGAVVKGDLQYSWGSGYDPFITLIPTTNAISATVVFQKDTSDVSENRFVVPEGWTLIHETLSNGSIRATLGNQSAVSHNVVFDLGEYGTVTNGTLNQSVHGWAKAEEPQFRVADGWFFKGWDADFSCVTSNMTVHAQYATIPEITKFEVSDRYPWNAIVDVEYEFAGEGIQPITEVSVRGDFGEGFVEMLAISGDGTTAGAHGASWFNNSVTGRLENCRFELAVSYSGKILCATNIMASLNLHKGSEIHDIGSIADIQPIKMRKKWAELPVPAWTNGTVRYVRTNGDDAADGLAWSSPKASIQAAINDAANGDLILVDGGIYAPITNGGGKTLTILGIQGAEFAIIDGGGTTRCADLSNGTITLWGFTLQNGYTTGEGGGTYRGTLVDCVVQNSTASNGGATKDATVWNSILQNNTAFDDGSASWGGTLYDCILMGNYARNDGGGSAGAAYSATLYNCVVTNNSCIKNGAGGIDASTAYGCVCSGNYRSDTGAAADWYNASPRSLEEGGAYSKPIDLTGLMDDNWRGNLEGLALIVNGDVYATTSNDEATVKWTPTEAGLWTLELAPIRDGHIVKPTETALFDCSAMEELTPATNLVMTATTTTMYENDTSGIRIFVKRVGGDHEDMTIGLTADVEGVVSFPETVTIPAGSRSTIFYARPVDDSIANSARHVRITAEATNFLSAEIELAVLDDELPKLTLTLDKTSVREGDGAITATVTREIAADEDTVVYLSGASTSRCSYPQSVTIPAGEQSVTFDISVNNNDTAEVAADLTIRASSAGCASASAAYTVEDDDVPGVTLALTPEIVSEGAGANAIYATLKRSDEKQIAQAVRVRLTASEANRLILPGEITIPKYAMAVRFAIGVVDNALDDGDRDVTINGAVVIESCGCNGQPSNGDVIQAVVGIIDDDGPALSLKAEPATMREGLDPAGWLTLSHNSVLDADMTVNLWVGENDDGEISIPKTVVIPAGEASVRIPVRTIDDGVEDGGYLVSVYAGVDGDMFAPASTWIQVSDQNLPDLQVACVDVPSSVIALENFSVAFAVTNIGFMARSGAIPYAVHIVRDANSVSSSTLVKSESLTGRIAVGGVLEGTVSLTAPEMPGDYRVAVVVDPEGTISELDSANNTGMSAAFSVGAAYTATVQVEDDTFLPGAEIAITGMATRANGIVAANVPVEVYVMVSGTRRVLSATTAEDGTFSATFTPSSGEAGDYTVGACYPGVGSMVAQDAFSIIGMRWGSTDNVIWDIALGDSVTRTVTIQNRSAVPLTGLTVTFTDVPEECGLAFALPETIPANGNVTLSMTATGNGLTEQEDYRKFYVYLEVNEGMTLDLPLYFHSQAQQAYLRATPSRIDTTMAIGETRCIDVTVVNDGKGDSGRVTVTVPEVDWLKIVGGATIDNLANGESATVTLSVSPTSASNLTLNNPLSGGSLAMNCANGTGCSIPLRFTPVSEATGGVVVDVIDDKTYMLASEPHVTNATIRVSNIYTGETVVQKVTGENGLCEIDDIPEGKYQLTVTAPNHEMYADEIVIEPSRTAKVQAFLQYRLVSITWDVVRTEIEDAYEITMQLDFDTSVPAPNVRVTMPNELPVLDAGESYAFNINVCNEGVIAAEWVRLTMPEIKGYEINLSDNGMKVPAGASIDIAAVISRPFRPLQGRRLASRNGTGEVACTRLVDVGTGYLCGKEYRVYEYEVYFKQGRCADNEAMLSELNGPSYYNGVSREPFGGRAKPTSTPQRNSQHGSVIVSGELQESPETIYSAKCFPDPCSSAWFECGISALTCWIPVYGCVLSAGICGRDIIKDGNKLTTWVSCVAAGLGCIPPLKCYPTVVSCASSIYANCNKRNRAKLLMSSGAVSFSGYDSDSRYDSILSSSSFVQCQIDRLKELLGDEKWLSAVDDELVRFLNYVVSLLEVSDKLAVSDLQDVLPHDITHSELEAFVARWNASVDNWAANGRDSVVEGLINLNAISDYTNQMLDILEYVQSIGYDSVRDYVVDECEKWLADYEAQGAKVCASVSLKLSQTLTMTREAFDGTLTLYNGNTTAAISDLKLDISVLDKDGNECKDLFEIFANGTSGDMSEGSVLAGGLSVSAGGTGSAMVRFVPERGAAPTEPKVYRFGGTVTYTDPASGEIATVNLYPVTLTVNPSPYLHLDYFVQRDVYADDPFTPDEVEASMPAELAVLVRNVGAGDARNVTIASARPEIVQNEKGLLVDFDMKDYSLDASALNGATAHLGLNTVSLGTIEPNESKVAQWWLTSTIEGHFIGMSATVTPVNSWNTPDTALVDPQVGVHKLVRSILADGDALPDFLVSDDDSYGTPNELYTARGDVLPVYVAAVEANATMTAGSEIEMPVTLSPARSGWNYGYKAVSGIFQYTISRIVRGDGTEIPLRNAWITDRTFRDGTTPLMEERLHIVDEFLFANAQTYTVYLAPKAMDVPRVTMFEGMADDSIESAPRDSLTVVFNKPVDPDSFTIDDLSLVKQGMYVADLSTISIIAADATSTRFTIGNLSSLCGELGRYELTVQCAGIADVDGNLGRTGKSVAWAYSASGAPSLVVLARTVGLAGTEFLLAFDKYVQSGTVLLEGVKLSRNGADVPLPMAATLSRRNDAEYVVSGLDSALLEDGVYELTFSANGVADEAGNVASGSKSVTWTVDGTPPAQISNLVISPDGGFSDTDGITYTGALTVSGTLPEAGLTVEIIARYVGGGETVLATMPSAGGDSLPVGAFSQNVVMPETGNATLVVRLTDVAGNSSDTELSVYVDGIALTGTLTGASEDEGVVTSSATLAFSDRVMDSDVTLERFSLTRNGEAVALEDVTLRRVGDNAPYQWELSGLDSLCSEDGVYVLRFDGSAVRKYTSGLMMSGSLVMRWRYENPDREPPTVTEVLFDGETPHEAYTNVFSSVSVMFSEAVNVPELIANGLIGRAARIDLLDVANSVTGSAVIASAMTWDGESNTLSWQIDPLSVPAGRARLVFDPTLITDMAGNHLAPAESQMFISGTKIFTSDLFKVGTAYSYACPVLHDWNGDGILDLVVGEKTADGKGKVRVYLNRGTKNNAVFDDYTYLQKDGADVEFAAQGCVGMQVSFGNLPGGNMVLAASHGEIYVWDRNTADWTLWFDHSTDARFASLIRTQTFCCDIDGDGIDEIVVSGQNSPMFWMKRTEVDGVMVTECFPFTDADGLNLRFPTGQNHTAAVMSDVNGDSIPDLVTGDTTGNVWVYYGLGGLRFAATPLMIYENADAALKRSRLACGDINGDGLDDILVGRSDGSILSLAASELQSPTFDFAVKAVVSASAGAHGAIAPVGDATYDGGDVPEYTITPDVGYHVVDVLVDTVSIGSTNNYVFAPLTTSHAIHADFAIDTFAVTFVAGAHGALSGETAQTIDYGGVAVVPTVTPDVGYRFTGWSGDVSAPIIGNVTFTAQYATVPYSITYTGLKGATNTNPETYTVEDAITFAAPGAVYGWVFKGWTPASIALGGTGAIEVAANWERQKFDVTVNGETWQYDYEEEVTFTAPEPTVDELCRTQFVYVGTSYTAPTVTNEFTVSITIGFEFAWDILATNYWFETAETQNGSITAPEAGWKPDGDEFTIAAVPAEHYHFTGWTGNTNGCVETNDVELVVTMDEARTIGATFAIDVFTVRFDLGEYGTLATGELVQTVAYGSAAIAPTLIVDDCYVFDGWDVAFDNVTSDVVVAARYHHKPPVTLTVAGVPDGATEYSHGNGTTLITYGDTVAVSVQQTFETANTSIQECAGWFGTGSVTAHGYSASTNITMKSDSSITWIWNTTKWWLETSAENGSVSVPSGWQTAGSTTELTAMPSAHYHFNGWTGTTNGCEVSGSALSVPMDGVRSIVANFEIDSHKISIGETLCDTIPSAGELDLTYGSMVTVEVVNAVINCGATQYVCKGWTATNADPSSGEGARAEFRVLGDVSFNWLWETNIVTLAQSVNAADLGWTTGGAAEWQPEWSDAANDSLHHARSGTIGNNTNTWIETTIEGAGTLSFVWKSSTEAKYDMFQLIVDGEVKGTISGETPWTTNNIVLAGGAHTIRWNYRKSRSGTAGADMVWLDSVTWTADVPPTLAEALNPDLFWTTDGDVEWTAVRKDTILDPHDDWATVGGLIDYESSLVGTKVYGVGVLTFDWAVSCEDGYDWFDFIADGEIRESITGETGWKTVTIEFKTGGKHILQWEYWKDDMDEAELVGDNRARLDNVRWSPVSAESQYTTTTPDPIPFADIRTSYSNYWQAAEGDYEVAAMMKGRNGYAVWESYVAGLEPDDENSKFEAKIEIVDGKPVVTWEPDKPELRATRIYTTYGKKTLLDRDWTPITDANKEQFNFFKIEVKMK